MPDVPPKQPVTGVDSVRMEPPSGLPPVNDPAQQAAEPFRTPVDPLPSAGVVAIHGGASQISPEAVPVLKAFQEYLESERQRASKRVIVLSCVFAGVIVFLLGAFALIYLKGQDRQERAQDRQDSLLQALVMQSMQQNQPAPQPVSPAPVQQQPSVQEITALITDAIAKDREAQNETLRKTISAYTDAIETAKAENAALKSELEKVKQSQTTSKPAQTVANPVQPAQKPLSPAQSTAQPVATKAVAPAQTVSQPEQKPAVNADSGKNASQPTPAAPQPQKLEIPKYPAPPPPEGFTSGSMTIRTGKDAKPVSWRVYVPER